MTQEISLITAFTAGFLSFFAPCILPMLPPYFAWLLGISESEIQKKKFRVKIFLNALFLVLGFAVVFIILGASASKLGRILSSYSLLIQKIGGLIIIIFGLKFAGFLQIFKSNLSKKLFSKLNRKTSSVLVGITFAFAWTACFSPILGSILVLSSFQETLTQGIILLSFYSLGLTVPFLLACLFLSLIMQKIKSFQRIIKYSNFIAGFILVVIGFLLISDNYYRIVMWISKIY